MYPQPQWSLATQNERDSEEDAAIDLERAIAELRFGRPVVVIDRNSTVALLALDAATPAQYEAFRSKSSNRQALYLSRFRAAALGLGFQPEGISIQLYDSDFSAASRLAYAIDISPPTSWRPAPQSLSSVCDLARLAQLLPAFVYAEIVPDEPTFERCPRLRIKDAIGKLAHSLSEFRCIARSAVPLDGLGECQFLLFRGGLARRDQLAIIVGEPRLSQAVPVRIHSSCITGDLLGSLKCDCGDQLHNAMAKLAALGGGILLYLDHEGRGTGLAAKLRAYSYQRGGLDTIDADAQLGFGPDEREYAAAVAMLRQLDITRINLLTNNPAKAEYLVGQGLTVEGCTPVIGPIRAENSGYLETKALRAGHRFPYGYLLTGAGERNGGKPLGIGTAASVAVGNPLERAPETENDR